MRGDAVPGPARPTVRGTARHERAAGEVFGPDPTTALVFEDGSVVAGTFGKVIKRGWDWLGLAPTAHAHISGLIEAPDLAANLTFSKNDFIRSWSHQHAGARRFSRRPGRDSIVARPRHVHRGRRASPRWRAF
jgi:hypothetical protein